MVLLGEGSLFLLISPIESYLIMCYIYFLTDILIMKEKFRRESFAHFINPVCLALGIIGFLLHFEVNFLNIGAIGIGAWGVTGLISLKIEKKL